MHGAKDGLAAVALRRDGLVQRVGRTKRQAFGQMIAGGVRRSKISSGMVGMLRERVWPRILIGVDAPLGLPEAFVESTAGPISPAPSAVQRTTGRGYGE